MKKIAIYSLFATLIIFGTTSCSSDERTPITAPIVDTAPIITTITTGSWKVTKYLDHTLDQTGHFTGYIFTFQSNGVITAFDGTNTYNGTWSITDNQKTDDSPEDNIDFNISFPLSTTTKDLEDITDDWDFISYSDSKLELVQDKTKPAKIDYITFEKN